MFKFTEIAILATLTLIFCSSCTTSRIIGDNKTPEVEIESSGIIWVKERQVKIGKIGKALKRAGFRNDQPIKVLVNDKNNRHLMQAVSSDLVMSGFMRPVFITNKITESTTMKK